MEEEEEDDGWMDNGRRRKEMNVRREHKYRYVDEKGREE